MIRLCILQGRSQDFSKGGGGHTGSNNIVMAFSPRNIVSCLFKKRLTRTPQDPPPPRPPSYAPVLVLVCFHTPTVNGAFVILHASSFHFNLVLLVC